MQHNVHTQYRLNFGPASQPIAGSMPVNRIRRWPNIETELGDCPVFALTALRVILYPPKGNVETALLPVKAEPAQSTLAGFK